MPQSIAHRAALSGFTQALYVDIGFDTLEGYAKLDTDFDDRFTMICGLTGDTLRVNGWLAGEITFVDQLDG